MGKNFMPAKIHALVCCPLHIVNTGEKEVELQKKFLDCEPDIVPGDFKRSFWRFYKCTDPIFGAIFCEKSHFSTRLNKSIVVLFIFTYGLYLQMILTEEPYVVSFFVITLPNALFWGPMMDYANLKSIKAAINGTTGCWLNFWNCFDRIKNIFMFCLCQGFFILTVIKLQTEIPLPLDYMFSYFFNGVIFPMAFNLIQTLILFKWSWELVEDPEHRPCWKINILALNGLLPASVSGVSILDTPGAKDHLEKVEKKDIEEGGAGTPGTEKALEPGTVPGKRSAEATAGTPKEEDQDLEEELVTHSLEKDSSHGDLTE